VISQNPAIYVPAHDYPLLTNEQQKTGIRDVIKRVIAGVSQNDKVITPLAFCLDFFPQKPTYYEEYCPSSHIGVANRDGYCHLNSLQPCLATRMPFPGRKRTTPKTVFTADAVIAE
jgi:hypothetical protein